MQHRRTLLTGLGIGLAVVIVLVLAGVIGWQLLQRYFIQQYYNTEYAPIRLAAGEIGVYPDEYHIADMPWIAADIPACQSTSLQMVAAQHGLNEPRQAIDFLMAFSYGFSEIPGIGGIFPVGSDPEVGLRNAAPYLGLLRRYYVTDDPQLFTRSLRQFLSRGYPVRLGLDMGALYGAPDFIAHSEMLVGYDPGGFYYYETVCVSPASCIPGERAAGDTGLYIDQQRLLQAVENQARSFQYPWRYALTVFEPGPRSTDLRPVWTQLAQTTVGGNPYGPPNGAVLLDNLASTIERRGTDYDVSQVLSGLEIAVRFRHENAQYLRQEFPGQADLEQAAHSFDRAADRYSAVLAGLGDGIADASEARQLAGWLREAASSEREAGEILRARGQ